MNNDYKKVTDWYSNNTEDYANKSAVLLHAQLKYFTSFLPKKGKVLDIGSGPGHDTEYFAKKGFEAVGIDFSRGMIQYSKKNRSAGDFKEMDMLCINNFFPKNYFNGIWASSSITHLKKLDIVPILKKIRNIVVPGGPVVIILKKRRKRKIKEGKIIFNEFYKKDIIEYAKKSRLHVIKIDDFSFSGMEWLFIHLIK